MKKLVVLAALLLGSVGVSAQPYTFVSGDESAISKLCVAATKSREIFEQAASDLGISALEKQEILCNGIALNTFVRKYSQHKSSAATYVFRLNDNNPLSKLCLAAIKSEDEYERSRQALMDDSVEVEKDVMCNGMPIKAFARKYRMQNLTASR